MTDEAERPVRKAQSSTKHKPGEHGGGDHIRQMQESGGGSKGSKGPVTPEKKHNPNSSAKT